MVNNICVGFVLSPMDVSSFSFTETSNVGFLPVNMKCIEPALLSLTPIVTQDLGFFADPLAASLQAQQ